MFQLVSCSFSTIPIYPFIYILDEPCICIDNLQYHVCTGIIICVYSTVCGGMIIIHCELFSMIPYTGVPLLHIVSNTIVLENPTRVSQKAHNEVRYFLTLTDTSPPDCLVGGLSCLVCIYI